MRRLLLTWERPDERARDVGSLAAWLLRPFICESFESLLRDSFVLRAHILIMHNGHYQVNYFHPNHKCWSWVYLLCASRKLTPLALRLDFHPEAFLHARAETY